MEKIIVNGWLLLKWTWNELTVFGGLLLKCLYYVLCVSVSTLYYIIEFLIVKRGELMSVLSTNHRDHSLSYEHELFSISSKKIFDWTERIDNIYITLLSIRFRFFTTNKIRLHIYRTKILIKCSVCCVWFIWVICLRLDSITRGVWYCQLFIKNK